VDPNTSRCGYGVRKQDLTFGEHTLGAVITWVDPLGRSDVQVFSKAQFEKPSGRADERGGLW
jgi:hypothetical protein